MNPMTFAGHKFDLRVWAVVLSLDPLRTPRCPKAGTRVSVCPRPPSLTGRITTGAGLCLSTAHALPRRRVLSVRIHVLVDESQACFSTDVFLQAAHPRAGDGPATRPSCWHRVLEPSPSRPSPLPRRHPEGQHVALLERAAPRQGRLQHAPHHAPLLRARRPGQAAAPPSLTAPSLTAPSLTAPSLQQRRNSYPGTRHAFDRRHRSAISSG